MKKSKNICVKKRLRKVMAGMLLCVGFFALGTTVSSLKANARTVDKIKVTQQEDDLYPIPDKYSTGVKGTLKTAKADGFYGGIQFKMSVHKDTGAVTANIRADWLTDLPGDQAIIENLDFSKMDVKALMEYTMEQDVTIIFRNCKFGKVSKDRENRRLNFVFENCSLVKFEGSNAKFLNCALGGSTDDAMHLYRNVSVTGCYFSDMSMSSASTHVDGVQLFGDERKKSGKYPERGTNQPDAKEELVDVYNIHFDHCRFEIPDLKIPDNKAGVNACFSMSLEFSNADDVTFYNSIVNGGSHPIYACTRTGENLTITNSAYHNIRVGGSKLEAPLYPKYDGVPITDLRELDSLYVASVWKNETGIHLSVTNDTLQKRTLLIVTDKGNFKKSFAACPNGVDFSRITKFSQLPFDQKVTVPKDCKYVVCLDVTDPKYVKQVRFVNYSGEDVYISKKVMGGGENLKEDVFFSGICGNDDSRRKEGNLLVVGDNVTFTLTKDYTLTIKGTGKMMAYNIKKGSPDYRLPPWYEYAGMIRKIVVEDGVTSIGMSAFKNCYAVTEVILPDSITDISSQAFSNCNSLKNLTVPAKASYKDISFSGSDIQITTR